MDYKDLQAGQTKENFWFRAKNDLINVLMKKACKNRKRLRILNIGAGTGDDLEVLNKFGKNYVIDIDKDALSVIDDKLCEERKIADACNLPYDDNFFDVAVSFDVFEHIKNDQKAISEVYRVLKENGVLIFTVPAFQFLFSSHDKALHHQRRYSKENIKTLLFQFNNLKIFFWNSLLFVSIATMRLLKRKSKPKVDLMDLPPWLNTLFFNLLKIDNFLIKRGISMPIGLSIVGFGYKQK
ncbi:putative S-adenosylmethionine-dependent methyltransferase/MSMEI_2290 [archaeon]|nr:putative S-adenosylmethionine-dependent methyltransferase/MSMEI_2290 [archaeon]